MRTKESEEMYLETILLLKRQKGDVRSVDIVEHLGYAKSSVSRAVNLLVKSGYLLFDKDSKLIFTERGEKRAEQIIERHKVLTQFFINIGADEKLAELNACRIEHVISEELFEIIKNQHS